VGLHEARGGDEDPHLRVTIFIDLEFLGFLGFKVRIVGFLKCWGLLHSVSFLCRFVLFCLIVFHFVSFLFHFCFIFVSFLFHF
jgi:hypothetical protein